MEELRQALVEGLTENLYQIIISNPRNKEGITKIKIRPMLKKGNIIFQESSFIENKALHINFSKEEMLEAIMLKLENFRQMEMESVTAKITVLVSKKGKITIKRVKNSNVNADKKIELSHNRQKKYLLEESRVIPFLVDLGIQTKDGNIVSAKYDKFKQINRYLEFVEDILPKLEDKEVIKIIDFGCGKAYLTFALYYYLTELKKRTVEMTGLDLKKDVIYMCNELAKRYEYTGLQFLQGDIGCYTGVTNIDMVVTLHACDTATDYALTKAIKWDAKVIFSVPCCQHEINGQIKNDMLQPILKYGVIKERIAALMTDAIRANVLEEEGYDTQILEFIDMEHTAKNLLIRAVKRENAKKGKKKEIEVLLKEMRITPSIVKLLKAREE